MKEGNGKVDLTEANDVIAVIVIAALFRLFLACRPRKNRDYGRIDNGSQEVEYQRLAEQGCSDSNTQGSRDITIDPRMRMGSEMVVGTPNILAHASIGSTATNMDLAQIDQQQHTELLLPMGETELLIV